MKTCFYIVRSPNPNHFIDRAASNFDLCKYFKPAKIYFLKINCVNTLDKFFAKLSTFVPDIPKEDLIFVPIVDATSEIIYFSNISRFLSKKDFKDYVSIFGENKVSFEADGIFCSVKMQVLENVSQLLSFSIVAPFGNQKMQCSCDSYGLPILSLTQEKSLQNLTKEKLQKYLLGQNPNYIIRQHYFDAENNQHLITFDSIQLAKKVCEYVCLCNINNSPIQCVIFNCSEYGQAIMATCIKPKNASTKIEIDKISKYGEIYKISMGNNCFWYKSPISAANFLYDNKEDFGLSNGLFRTVSVIHPNTKKKGLKKHFEKFELYEQLQVIVKDESDDQTVSIFYLFFNRIPNRKFKSIYSKFLKEIQYEGTYLYEGKLNEKKIQELENKKNSFPLILQDRAETKLLKLSKEFGDILCYHIINKGTKQQVIVTFSNLEIKNRCNEKYKKYVIVLEHEIYSTSINKLTFKFIPSISSKIKPKAELCLKEEYKGKKVIEKEKTTKVFEVKSGNDENAVKMGAEKVDVIPKAPVFIRARHIETPNEKPKDSKEGINFFIGDENRNEYVVDGVIGSGGFAVVEKVRNQTTGELYARKSINKLEGNNISSKEKVMYIIKEFELLEKCYHPFIVRLIGFSLTYNEIYIELLDCDLGVRLGDQKNPLSADQRTMIALEIALGMQFLHKNKIIHRDIKPQNILLKLNENFDGFDHARISDLGAARIADSIKTMTSIGSRFYMAPEVLCEEPYDISADVFSFGILLMYIATLKAPSFNIINLLKNKEICVHVPNEQIDLCEPILLQMVDKCTSLIPNERPSFKWIVKTMKANNFSFIKGASNIKQPFFDVIEKVKNY